MKRILTAILVLLVAGAGAIAFWYIQTAKGVSAGALEGRYTTSADRFVEIAGTRVRVREEGPEGAPAILLIHGFSFSLESWDAWAEVLTQDYRVIRYDLLGHGLTGPDPRERYSPIERAAFVGEVLDALRLENSIIAGNSLGGLAAWRFAAANPDRVNALVLISPGGFPQNGVTDAPAEVPPAMKAYLLTAPEAGVKASAELIYADDTKVTEERLTVLRDMMRREGNGAAMIKSIEEFTLPDPSAELSRISAPTLLLWGEEDLIIPVSDGRRFAALIPDAKLITYPGVGHTAQEEIPQQTVADTMEFLAALKAANRVSAE